MNAENYKKWLMEKLIPNLPPNSVLIIDNAPYYNIQLNKAPTSKTNKKICRTGLPETKSAFKKIC